MEVRDNSVLGDMSHPHASPSVWGESGKLPDGGGCVYSIVLDRKSVV